MKPLTREERLALELINIRELLRSQPDRECLGVNFPDHPEQSDPWCIVDEVIDSITKAISYKI